MDAPATPGLSVIAREWTRIGTIGFGGPPAHVALLRRLCVTNSGWVSPAEFEDALAVTNMLPGPASTQLAIFCAWRMRGVAGAVIGGLGFIVPGLVAMLALTALFLAGAPPIWVLGAGAGAGAAVPAVAAAAGIGLLGASARRAAHHWRWLLFVALGAAGAIAAGPLLVAVLVGCGLVEVALRRGVSPSLGVHALPVLIGSAAAMVGGIGSLAWVALKVGALSFGGGFVIIPLMQADAVGHYHWMSATQFLDVVALGQITPGPVVQTAAGVGYAAAGIGGGLLAALIVFAPSFVFVLGGGRHFHRLRANHAAQGFLAGAGPAAIGAILGSVVALARALHHGWQFALLAGATVAVVALRRSVPLTLLAAGVLGALVALAGGAT